MNLEKMNRVAWICGAAGTLVSAFCWGFIYDKCLLKQDEEL